MASALRLDYSSGDSTPSCGVPLETDALAEAPFYVNIACLMTSIFCLSIQFSMVSLQSSTAQLPHRLSSQVMDIESGHGDFFVSQCLFYLPNYFMHR